MRRMRISFLMLAAIGGCTPLIEQRQPDNPSTQAQAAVNRSLNAPPPAPAKWTAPSEPPGPAVRPESMAYLSASTHADGSVTSGEVKVAKQPLPPDVPAGAATLPKSSESVQAVLHQVDNQQFVSKNDAIQQTSLTPAKGDKPAGPSDRSTDVDARTMPAPMAPPGNLVDIASAPMVQQPAFRMVNTKKFTLNFKVEDVGVSGISTVDLWSTQDMRTWKKVESVQQVANALLVEVKDEGMYGFTLVAHNGNGLGKSPPQQGELPQVWVSVNTTPPAVSLAGVEMSLTSKVPSLILRWTAKDHNFGPRPVTLSYSASQDGPWTLLATNVENSGRFEWPLPSCNVPSSMYIRVQAADMNGNVGYAQTESPVHLDTFTAKAEVAPEPARSPTPPPPAADGSRPNARILDVEPDQQ